MKKILFIIINVVIVVMCGYILATTNKHFVIDRWPIIKKEVSVKHDAILSDDFYQIDIDIAGASIITDVLETQIGTMSAYGPDCLGCSGHLGGGFDATGGNYTYFDSTFGEVRIVAGDAKYPYGTIIRVKNSKLDEFNAIVLDRGGAIGIGRTFLFDLLFSSNAEAATFGTSYNVTFEVLRYGY